MPGLDPFYDVPYGLSRPPAGSLVNQSHPLSKGLVGCYLLGDSQTRYVQNLAIPNKYTLNIVNGPVSSVGRFNCPATKFTSASNQYLESLTVPLTAAPLSFVAWFNIDTAAVYDLAFLFEPAVGQDFFGMYANSTNGTTVTAGAVSNTCGSSVSEVIIAASNRFAANTWNQGVTTFTSPTLRAVYLNGRGKVTSATSRTPANISQINMSGVHLNSGTIEGAVNGLIDHVLIYSRALTDQEVLWLYEQPFAMFEPQKRWGMISIPAAPIVTAGGTGRWWFAMP